MRMASFLEPTLSSAARMLLRVMLSAAPWGSSAFSRIRFCGWFLLTDVSHFLWTWTVGFWQDLYR